MLSANIRNAVLMTLAVLVAASVCVCSFLPGLPEKAYALEGADASFTVVDASGTVLSPSSASAKADSSIEVGRDADTARAPSESFGVSSFARQNKGTNRSVDGTYYGYRWPVPAEDAVAVVIADGYTLVYADASLLESLGVSLEDEAFQSELLAVLATLDAAASEGGVVLESLNNPVYFTTSRTVTVGDYRYDFAVEVQEGYYYTISNLSGSEDGSGGGLYAESCLLTTAAGTEVVAAPSGMDAVSEFFETLDWSPLWVSLRTTGVAIVFIFVLGILAAWATMRMSNKTKGLFDTIFTIPMVLPPTVCGYLLLRFFGTSSPTGEWLIAHGIDLVFTWPAAVIACVVVGFPLMYRTARGAFENLDPAMLDAARTLGWSEARVFMRLMVPLAWPSIAAGTVLGFARAMGEFGCTLFFAGNAVGTTQTIPIAIYFDWMGGNTAAATFWVIVVIAISFLVILFINIYSSRTQRYKRRLGE